MGRYLTVEFLNCDFFIKICKNSIFPEIDDICSPDGGLFFMKMSCEKAYLSPQ
jgi:hypothetical protein